MEGPDSFLRRPRVQVDLEETFARLAFVELRDPRPALPKWGGGADPDLPAHARRLLEHDHLVPAHAGVPGRLHAGGSRADDDDPPLASRRLQLAPFQLSLRERVVDAAHCVHLPVADLEASRAVA